MIMEGVLILISAGLGFTLLLTVINKTTNRTKKKRVPPGPSGWPLVGQGLTLSLNKAYLKFTEWNKTFGDIASFSFFGRRVVILSNPEVIRRAFHGAEYGVMMSDRPQSFIGQYVADMNKDILFRQYDSTCQKLKSTTVRAMHDVITGSDIYYGNLRKEIQNYVKCLQSRSDSDIDIIQPINLSLCRLIGCLFTGELLADNDEMLTTIVALDHLGDAMVMPETHLVFKLFPFLRFLPGSYGRMYRQLMDHKRKLRDFIFTENTKRTFRAESLIYKLLQQQKSEPWLTDDFIVGVLMDLINTATLTSQGVLSGFLFLLVHFKDVQSKVRQEINDVIGKERQPCHTDRQKMPYTFACILETLRYQSHLGITATHTASCDVTFDGYSIPKGASIYGNLWAVHHDERFWSEPWSFKPERFLDENGSLIEYEQRHRFLMPFGVGHRSCMGVSMTYDRMFLYITTLLQHHELSPPVSQSLPSHDPRELIPGTVLQAPRFLCRVVSSDELE